VSIMKISKSKFIAHAVQERFLKPENRALVLARNSVSGLLRALEDWRPVRVEKWLDRETR